MSNRDRVQQTESEASLEAERELAELVAQLDREMAPLTAWCLDNYLIDDEGEDLTVHVGDGSAFVYIADTSDYERVDNRREGNGD